VRSLSICLAPPNLPHHPCSPEAPYPFPAAFLEVHCSLPGGKPDTEGVRLSVATFKFVQDTGATLFHVLDD